MGRSQNIIWRMRRRKVFNRDREGSPPELTHSHGYPVDRNSVARMCAADTPSVVFRDAALLVLPLTGSFTAAVSLMRSSARPARPSIR